MPSAGPAYAATRVDVDNLARVVAQIRRTGLFVVTAESLAVLRDRRRRDRADRDRPAARHATTGPCDWSGWWSARSPTAEVLTILRRLSEEHHHHSVAEGQRVL